MSTTPISPRAQPLDPQDYEGGMVTPDADSGKQGLGQSAGQSAAARVTSGEVVASPSRPRLPLQSFEELEIPDSFRQAVERELTGDEKILWLGRPSRNREVHPSNAWMGSLGIGLIVLGCLVVVVSFGAGVKIVFPFVFAVVLGIIGSLLLLGRKADPTRSCRWCYVVTNRRAILMEMSVWAGGPKARSYLPQQLLGMERRNHPEVAGAGDLIFEYTFVLPGNSFDLQTGGQLQQGASLGLSNQPQRVPRGFFLLDQVREVENLIRTTLLGQLEKALDEPQGSTAAPTAADPASELISINCACGLTVETPASLAGKAVKCPQCSAAVAVPASQPQEYRDESGVPADLKAKALADLDASEKVVWLGQPVRNLVFLRSGGWLIGAGIGILIALVWLIGALTPAKAATATVRPNGSVAKQAAKMATTPARQEAPNLLPPIGLLLVSACCGAVPFVRRHLAGRTCYALTNRRALVYKQGLFAPSRESYSPLEVAQMKRSDSWLVGGSGDLIFRTVTVVKTSSSRGNWSQSVKRIHYGFLAVAEVQEVAKLVRATLIDRFVDRLQQANSL